MKYLIPLLLTVFISLPVFADQLREGEDAFNCGYVEEAVKLWTPLAKNGDMRAEFRMGGAYSLGLGVNQSNAIAAQWWNKAISHYRAAADAGDAVAQNFLGQLYSTPGIVVRTDFVLALRYSRMAAEQGNTDAEVRLGGDYDNGIDGAPQDKVEALKWYSKAANQGDSNAQGALGDIYQQGDGVDQDWQKSYFWRSLSASTLPVVDAAKLWSAKHLSKEQVKAVDQQVEDWKKDHTNLPLKNDNCDRTRAAAAVRAAGSISHKRKHPHAEILYYRASDIWIEWLPRGKIFLPSR